MDQGGVVPTLNAFDCGDTRATVVIVMREREGKAGGGKGPLLSDRSFTLSTSNFQTLFIIDGTRVGDVRVYEDQVMQTIIQRWGTGGGNVPAIAFHHKQNPISGEVSPALGTSTQGMGVHHQTVRRLTPTECERLQGFPDGWTEGQADSHRYKQLGNAVAVPVVQWLINRTTGKD